MMVYCEDDDLRHLATAFNKLHVFCFFFSQLVCERQHVYASVCAVSRAYSLFSRKSSVVNSDRKQTVVIEVLLVGEDTRPLTQEDIEVCNRIGKWITTVGVYYTSPLPYTRLLATEDCKSAVPYSRLDITS